MENIDKINVINMLIPSAPPSGRQAITIINNRNIYIYIKHVCAGPSVTTQISFGGLRSTSAPHASTAAGPIHLPSSWRGCRWWPWWRTISSCCHVPFEHHPSDGIAARLQNKDSTSPDTVSLPRTTANHYNPYPPQKKTFFNHLNILHSRFYFHSNFISDPFLFRWSLILFLFINTSNFIRSLWSNIFFRLLPLSELYLNWCWTQQK